MLNTSQVLGFNELEMLLIMNELGSKVIECQKIGTTGKSGYQGMTILIQFIRASSPLELTPTTIPSPTPTAPKQDRRSLSPSS